MSTHPNLNNEPDLLKMKTRYEEIRNLKIKRKNLIMKI